MSYSANRAETHARHILREDVPLSLDDVLHVSRYRWTAERQGTAENTIDLGCGTGYGAKILSQISTHVIGVDFDPAVSSLNETLGLPNVDFICADICSPRLRDALVMSADLVVSMETIEHLEDYFSYLDNAVALLSDAGTFVVATPNRTMTYEHYPSRRHMDPSHVQEFTAVALEKTLRLYFSNVEIYLQTIRGFWTEERSKMPVIVRTTPVRRFIRGWVPPNLVNATARFLDRGRPAASPYEETDVEFIPLALGPDLLTEAFGLIAICRV